MVTFLLFVANIQMLYMNTLKEYTELHRINKNKMFKTQDLFE